MSKFFVGARIQYCLVLLLSSYTIGAAEVSSRVQRKKINWSDEEKKISFCLYNALMLDQLHQGWESFSGVLENKRYGNIDRMIPDKETHPTNALIIAVKGCLLKGVESALTKGAKPDTVDGYGRVALSYALEGIWNAKEGSIVKSSKFNFEKKTYDEIFYALINARAAIKQMKTWVNKLPQDQEDKKEYIQNRCKKLMKEKKFYDPIEVANAIKATAWIEVPADIGNLICEYVPEDNSMEAHSVVQSVPLYA